MKKLVKIFVILLISLIFPIGLVFSFSGGGNPLTTFSGASHDLEVCHGNIRLSVTGAINLTSSAGSVVNPGSEFNISVTIKKFTEAAGQTVTLAFAPEREDNNQFEFTVSYIKGLAVNLSGFSITTNFTVTAPSSTGDFKLTADAMDDPAGGGDEDLQWTYGSILITVGGSNGPGDSDYTMIIMIGTISSIVVLVVVASLTRKFLIGIKRY